MAEPLIDQLRELSRRKATGDNKYHLKGQFTFVLRSDGVAQQFPLVMNPESFDYELPFAAELTPLQEGGVVSEEGGIVIAEITIAGTTGFKLRLSLADISSRQGEPEFTGGVDPGGRSSLNSPTAEPLSGHMHFWRLANRCFDQYSSLKKNPAKAHRTSMEFHTLKDDLHLTVVPRVFKLTRTASRERVSYRYNIRLAVVGRAEGGVEFARSPDDPLLKRMKDGLAGVRVALQSIQGEVNDLTASLDEIRRVVTSAAGILDDVGDILDAGNNLISGARKSLDVPAAFISSTADLVESAANLTTSSGAFPADVAQAWNKIADGLDALKVASQGLFRESFDEISRRYQKRSEGYKTGQDSTKDELAQDLAGAAASSQGRLSVQRAFGGAVKPGDVLRGRLPSSDSRSRLQPGRFKGFREVVVNQGDTVQSLAAKYMGDANDWPHIVLTNKLKAPYITASAQLPGTVHPGDRVSVPIPDNQQDPPTFTTGNPEDGASQIEALLGTDFERERLSNGKFGWAIDTAGGSTDVRKVSGLANLGQGLEGRLRTERGHNILYPNAGMPRQVGNRNTDDGIVSASYEARQQVLADRRVERITSLRFTNELDVRELATDVVPIGFSSARAILRQLT